MPSSLPKENIYGHTKKLRYILTKIDDKLAKFSSGKIALLDFGCGNGSAVSQFLMRDEVDYIGVDIHQPSLDYARAHFSGPKVSFIDHIPIGSRFDIIIYADIIEHLDDPVAILREHYSLLNDDGIIVGAVPNGYGPFENEKRLNPIDDSKNQRQLNGRFILK
ncbi:3-demethylubiquinone-9 3-O-methyltransferase, partial [Candidatus Thiomargarita nelsonii]